jgi:dynein heavy chain, axonemal
VDGLVAPLERVPFDIFDRKYKDSWHMVMQQFRRAVEEIESMTKSFIEQSFQKLRSAEGAFELVQNFKNIQVRLQPYYKYLQFVCTYIVVLVH